MKVSVKLQRHRRIATLLRRHAVGSQAELATLLRRAGERVTQATLSRDLEELGAFKTRLPDGRTAYRLPEEQAGKDDHLRHMLNEFLVDFDVSGSLVVLRTPPGCAQPVARAIDTGAVKDIIGTIAGDDTILVICKEGVSGRVVADRLDAMAAGAAKGA